MLGERFERQGFNESRTTFDHNAFAVDHQDGAICLAIDATQDIPRCQFALSRGCLNEIAFFHSATILENRIIFNLD